MTFFTQDWFSHNIPNFESIKVLGEQLALRKL